MGRLGSSRSCDVCDALHGRYHKQFWQLINSLHLTHQWLGFGGVLGGFGVLWTSSESHGRYGLVFWRVPPSKCWCEGSCAPLGDLYLTTMLILNGLFAKSAILGDACHCPPTSTTMLNPNRQMDPVGCSTRVASRINNWVVIVRTQETLKGQIDAALSFEMGSCGTLGLIHSSSVFLWQVARVRTMQVHIQKCGMPINGEGPMPGGAG